MDYNNLLVESSDDLAIVSFNRPKVLNALNRETLEELIDIVNSLAANDDVKVVIVTGAGEKAFIAGADIAEMKDMKPLDALEFMKLGHEAISGLEELQKPVIAAVNGFALGGGAELTLACDFSFASENAKFGFPEVGLGIFPGFGGTQRLPRLIGKARAKELILTGKMISAQEAFEIGLTNRVFPTGELLNETKKVASKIASNSTVGVKLAKAVIDKGYDLDLANGRALERNTISLCFSSEDQKKRMTAFLEKG